MCTNSLIEMYVLYPDNLNRRVDRLKRGSELLLLVNTEKYKGPCLHAISQEYYDIDETINGLRSKTVYYVRDAEDLRSVKAQEGKEAMFKILDIKIPEIKSDQIRIYVLVELLPTT
jgi:hypothetical protein